MNIHGLFRPDKAVTILALTSVALAAAGCSKTPAGPLGAGINTAELGGGPIDNPYIPLTPGTKFRFEGKTDRGLEVIEVEVARDTKEVLGVKTIAVKDTVTLDGIPIEDTLDWYAQDKAGNVRYFGETTKEYENGEATSTAASWEAGVKGAVPGIYMYASPRVGQVYRQEYFKGEAEDAAQILGVSERVNECAKGDWTMAAVTVEAARLTKRYGTRTAVDEVSFTAHQGEVVGLLGPNGAGKTTAIRLLTTILAPTSGEFRIAGIAGSQPNDIRRHIGVLPESAGYPENQTGQEFLRYHGRLFGMNGTDAGQAASRLLAEVGLTEREASRISTYSRGMRQRLGIARALINNPSVVFLDEPTLGLDPAGQRQVLGIIRDIAQRRGATVVLSTHTMPEVEDVCSSVLILHKGSVIAMGTVSEVISKVATQPTAQLRVPAEQVDRARQALTSVAGVQIAAEGTDMLQVMLPNADTNAVLRAVLDAQVPVLSFDVKGTRLSDAFLAMTTVGKP